MTLEEAIKHCDDKVKELGCTECGKEHQQLAGWLKELKEIKDNEESKKTAEQMFKELGLKKGQCKTCFCSDYTEILFESNKVRVIDYSDYHEGYDSLYLNKPLLEAINKQIKELGW